jgi:hypothetical protein
MNGQPKKRLGELLIEAGIIDEMQLKSALGHQRQWGVRLGQALVDMKLATEPDIVNALAQRHGFEVARLDALEAYAHQQALGLVPCEFAVRNNVFPMQADTSTLTVAMSDPSNLAVVDELRFRTGRRVKVTIGGDHEIAAAVKDAYPGEGGIEAIALDLEADDVEGEAVFDPFGGGSEDAMDAFFGSGSGEPATPARTLAAPSTRGPAPDPEGPRPATAAPAPPAPASIPPRARPMAAGAPAGAPCPAASPRPAASPDGSVPSRPAPPAAPPATVSPRAAPPGPAATPTPPPHAARPAPAAPARAVPSSPRAPPQPSPIAARPAPAAPRAPAPPAATPAASPAARPAAPRPAPPMRPASAGGQPAAAPAPADELAIELEPFPGLGAHQGARGPDAPQVAPGGAPPDELAALPGDALRRAVAGERPAEDARSFDDRDRAILEALERLASGGPAEPEIVKPTQAIGAVIQILLRKGVVDPAELLAELRRR